ncbi:MAG: hypothetical protein LBC91_01995 [Candidatus Accumulibacter sp.]|nr:hypothetical protein [Accumulibacter sp.]
MRFPVFIELRRSSLLAGALCLMHGAAACAVLVLPWPLPARLALLIALAASLAHSLRPPRFLALRLHRDGLIECVLPDETCLPARPLPDTAVFSWLVVLRLEAEDQTISLPLLPDHLSREEFRLLRLWLRWGIDPGREADPVG